MEEMRVDWQTNIVDGNCQQRLGSETEAMEYQEWRVAVTRGPSKTDVLYVYWSGITWSVHNLKRYVVQTQAVVINPHLARWVPWLQLLANDVNTLKIEMFTMYSRFS